MRIIFGEDPSEEGTQERVLFPKLALFLNKLRETGWKMVDAEALRHPPEITTEIDIREEEEIRKIMFLRDMPMASCSNFSGKISSWTKLVKWIEGHPFGHDPRIQRIKYSESGEATLYLTIGDMLLMVTCHHNIFVCVDGPVSLLASEAGAKWLSTLYKPLPTRSLPTISLIVERYNNLDTQTVAIRKPTLTLDQLDLFYGAGMREWHESAAKALLSRRNGIVIIHGDPGGGKTSYIRWLAWELRKKREIVILPRALLEMLSTPRFVSFLLDLHSGENKLPKLLIIEDAEEIVSDTSRSMGTGVSTLLNLTDGLLNDVADVQILVTFNCPISKIDPALLRPGRLIGRREFGALTDEEARALAQSQGREVTWTDKKPKMLCDVLSDPTVETKVKPPKHTLGFV